MHKLVILIEAIPDRSALDEGWPEFLHLVENMPGLLKESSSQVEEFLYGDRPYTQVHELFFDSLANARQAMVSASGQSAGALLQRMTNGRFVLFFADHKEDDLENIRKYRGADA